METIELSDKAIACIEVFMKKGETHEQGLLRMIEYAEKAKKDKEISKKTGVEL